MLRIDPTERLRRRDFGGVPGGLARAEIAAVAEYGEQVALDGLRELRIGARGWPKVAGVTGPVLGMLEDVQEVALRHAGAHLLLELGQPGGLLRGRQLLQVRCPIGIDAQLGVGRETGVDRSGERRQLGLQHGGEILTLFRDAKSGTVGRQPCFAVCPGQELGAIVGKGFRADDVEVAGLQGVGQVDEHADFERAPVKSARFGPALGDKALPALGRKAEIDVASTSSRRA